jgi:uncharacterized membrane protein
MSKFAYEGHPFHPMLIPLPIGLFAWTIVCDAVYLFSGREDQWYDFAFWTSGAGVLAALAAAVPGLGDYLSIKMPDRTRVIATAHMASNLVAVGLFAVAWLLMLNDGATGGTRLAAVVAMHLGGISLLAVGGWLGGNMVYLHRVGVADGERAALEILGGSQTVGREPASAQSELEERPG